MTTPIHQTPADRAAAPAIANLDTDQIMPKQFLRGIDKAGLAKGLLYDLRFRRRRQPARTSC
jgi:3-isopropylmalate/(R)-2-methylmalate dehydratase small subunit